MNMKKILIAVLAALMPLGLHAAELTEVEVSGVRVTSKALAAELKAYISSDVKAKGGWFIIQDEAEKSLVKLKPLKLDDGAHIHRLGEIQFLSWGEFKDPEGIPYMIDFYFDLKDGRLVMSAPLTIYKKGKEKRYGWDESGPLMKKTKI